MPRRFSLALLLLALTLLLAPPPARAAGITYYVANGGDDGNSGLSPETALASVGAVNGLALQPGDRVLFACGDIWRAEMLTISASGTAAQPITFGSYPTGCEDQPILSGAQPVSGWKQHAGQIYVADLAAGDNGARFSLGINQLFRGGKRLPLGRWPNLDGGGGYATIDGQPVGDQIVDNALPVVDWTGAVAHIRAMRWYILNRQVTGSSGSTLSLNHNAGCWGGSCQGWGYWLNNHLATLDREGEWFYDAATDRLYLYSESGTPAPGTVEASVVLQDDDRSWGGVNLGQDLLAGGISHVVVENLAIQGWWRHGIATPTNHAHTENHHITLRDNTITDVDSTGINLAAWVWGAEDGRPDGWRGGYAMTVRSNTIEGANHMGINARSRESTFSDNIIRDVGRIKNLGATGLGCSYTDGEGQCTEDGDGLRIKTGSPEDSGAHNTITGNRLERIAYNGMDIFGHHNNIERNVIRQACYVKGDCGAVRTYGSGNLDSTAVHDLLFRENIIIDTIGNTDGCSEQYEALFGFGLYIDHYSRDVDIVANTVLSSTAAGVLYQNSTGSLRDNVLYNNSAGSMWSAQVVLTGSPTQIADHRGNILYSLQDNAWTLRPSEIEMLSASDGNYFFHPYEEKQIAVGGWSGRLTLAEWQAASGLDGASKRNWFSLDAGEAPRSRVFYNETSSTTAIDLGERRYLSLDQDNVVGSISLPPYRSEVLVDNGRATLMLASLSPSLYAASEAADFTLTLEGTGFGPNSTVRWDGDDRPTSYVNSTRLTATIPAADVGFVAETLVTVYDPAPPPTGSETPPLLFRVVESLFRGYLPLVIR